MSMFNQTQDGPSNSSNWWNYSDPEKTNYCTSITGDVVEMAEMQRTEYGTGRKLWWLPNGQKNAQGRPFSYEDTGKPVLDLKITLVTEDGEEVMVGCKSGRTNIMQALWNALKDAKINNATLGDFAGKNISIATKAVYKGNARPFNARINGEGKTPFRGFIEYQAPKKTDQQLLQENLNQAFQQEVPVREVYTDEIPF